LEDVEICLGSVKAQSLTVLWKACSHVEGKNAANLYQELQEFDFGTLGSDVPREWQFGEFLSWLNLQVSVSFEKVLLIFFEYPGT
jgi:hypothetical protein